MCLVCAVVVWWYLMSAVLYFGRKLGMAISCMALCNCRCRETRAPTCQYCLCWFIVELLSELPGVCTSRHCGIFWVVRYADIVVNKRPRYNNSNAKCYRGDTIWAISRNRHTVFFTGWIITVFFTVWLLWECVVISFMVIWHSGSDDHERRPKPSFMVVLFFGFRSSSRCVEGCVGLVLCCW